MNARWFRDNVTVLIFSVSFLAILGGILLFLRGATTAQGTILSELETQQAELRRLLETKPYPSNENIDALKRDQEQIKRLYSLMQNAAAREVVQPPELNNPIDFSRLHSTILARLTESATNNNVSIGESFAWGFSRYGATFPCKNPALKGDDCTRLLRLLAKQMLIVERLGGLLISNKVDTISAIRRTEVEGGGGADVLNVPITDNAKSLYRVYPFEIQFTASTDALRSFLNSLVQADHLYLVRHVHIDSTVQQTKQPPAPVIQPAADSGDVEPRVPEQPKIVDVRRLNVTVRLDLIEFKPSETKPVKR